MTKGQGTTGLAISIRRPNRRDFVKLQRMLGSFDGIDKRFFHPGIGLNSPYLLWVPYQLIFILNGWHFVMVQLMRAFPRLVRIDLVAVDKKDNVVGFAYLNVREKYGRGKYSADFGIALSPLMRGRGIASVLMQQLLRTGFREGVRRVKLIVMSDNEKAIRLYTRFGFRPTRIVSDRWRNENYESIEMMLDPSDS